MKVITYKFTDTEYDLIGKAKTEWLNRQGMDIKDAKNTTIENWVLDHLIWKITWNLIDKPAGFKVGKRLPKL